MPGTGTWNNRVFYPPESYYNSSSGLGYNPIIPLGFGLLIVTQNKDYISQAPLQLDVVGLV